MDDRIPIPVFSGAQGIERGLRKLHAGVVGRASNDNGEVSAVILGILQGITADPELVSKVCGDNTVVVDIALGEEIMAEFTVQSDPNNKLRRKEFQSSNEACNGAGVLCGVLYYIARRESDGTDALVTKTAQRVIAVTNQLRRTLGEYQPAVPQRRLLEGLYVDLHEKGQLFPPLIPALLNRARDPTAHPFIRITAKAALHYLDGVNIGTYREIHAALSALSSAPTINSPVYMAELEHAHAIDRTYVSIRPELRPYATLVNPEFVLAPGSVQNVPTIRTFGSIVIATKQKNWGAIKRQALDLSEPQRQLLTQLVLWYNSSTVEGVGRGEVVLTDILTGIGGAYAAQPLSREQLQFLGMGP